MTEQPTTWSLDYVEPQSFKIIYSETFTTIQSDQKIQIELPVPLGTYKITLIVEKEQ